MKHIVSYIESGRPIIGLRTATHAFQFKTNRTYPQYSWNSKDPDGGFGRQVLGETWIAHHGRHGKESTRGILVPSQKGHPILRGVGDGAIWGPTDVYRVRLPLPGDSQPLVLGQVLAGMEPSDPAVEGPQNEPMMPIAWTRTFLGTPGKPARVFTTTMGASQDFLSEAFRRLVINAVYWAIGMDAEIPQHSKVDLVGEYNPTPFGFNGFKRGIQPADLHRTR
jgi:hypothetical protein